MVLFSFVILFMGGGVCLRGGSASRGCAYGGGGLHSVGAFLWDEGLVCKGLVIRVCIQGGLQTPSPMCVQAGEGVCI